MRRMSQLDARSIFQIERPDAKLLTYYILSSLLLGPFAVVALVPLYFRYHTLRYRFDEEGISMAWGILFRREIHLTYSRIQDIHLVANFVERWLGLARIQIQTASGSSKAEMTLEGILESEMVRDFLYSRMRGARDAREAPASRAALESRVDAGASPAGPASAGIETGEVAAATPFPTGATTDELAAVLAEVAAELRAVRLALEARGPRHDIRAPTPAEPGAGG